MGLLSTLAGAAALVAGAAAFGQHCEPNKRAIVRGEPVYNGPVVPNLQIAFFGDGGLGANPTAVLRMAQAWGAEAMFHLGDFDYESDPDAWTDLLNSVVGPDYPYFGVIGNHDSLRWDGYQANLQARLERFNGTAYCDGELGLSFTCNYKGVLVAMTGVGTRATPADGAAYLATTLSAYPNIWQTCMWHKNQHLYQTGNKIDEVGWEVYETCREHGAIILTGHEHSYSRTHLMSDFEGTVVASTDNTLVLEPGKTFAAVAGLGGKDIRNWDGGAEENPWWAVCAASDNGVNYGALLCTFNVNGDPRLATCEFTDISGRVWDSFTIRSNLSGTSAHAGAPTVRTARHEITITDAAADRQVDLATGAVDAHGAELRFGAGQEVQITFTNFPLARAAAIKNVQLQVMGSRGDGATTHPTFLVRALLPSGERTQAAIAWTVDGDDFSANTVWHSPSLAAVAREVADAYGPRKVGAQTHLTLVMSSDDATFAIYARDTNACVAATLAYDL